MTKRWIVFSGLFFGAACVGAKDQEADSGGADDSSNADTSPEQKDTGCEPSGTPDPGVEYERDDPEFLLVLGDKSFDGTPGNWSVRSQGCLSSLSARSTQGTAYQTVSLEIYGDISGAGSYPIRRLMFSEGDSSQEEMVYEYSATDPGVNFVVTGYASKIYLHGSVDGSFPAIDKVTGGSSKLESLQVENWPIF